MPDIRYVCLSDLHLGAVNSVLTHLDEDGNHVDGPAPLLSAVLDGLRELVAASGSSKPPTLVLHGDLFELALTTTEIAAQTFGHFVVAAWGGPGEPLFGDEVLFVPGNHDHHLWEVAREHQYEEYLHGVSDSFQPMPHVTPMVPEQLTRTDHEPFVADFARRALERHGSGSCPTFKVLYPNLGLVDAHGERAVIVTHGHYLEPMYRAMSLLHDIVTPERPPRADVRVLEADNWAWIDFFWSTMGRSGEDEGSGDDDAIPVLYELLQDKQSVEAIVDRIVDDLLPRKRSLVRTIERWAARRGGHHVAAAVVQHERGQPAVLSAAASAGLDRYLEGPVRNQLVDELATVPTRVDLIFGHTHKPFAACREPEGFPGPVVVHNSGGWVVDTVHNEPVKGASAVLVSDELEVVDLWIYRQEANPDSYQVSVPPIADPPDEPTPLRQWLQGYLEPTAEPWAGIAKLALRTVGERQRQLADRIARGTRAVRSAPASGSGAGGR